MQFNSYSFIFLFLPAVIAGFFLCNKISRTAGKVFLIAAGAVFYLKGGIAASVVFVLSIALNYIMSVLMVRKREHALLIMRVMIIADVAVLFIFKYLNYSLDLFGQIMGTDLVKVDLVLPLGISFFTFQQIMWAVWLYRSGRTEMPHLDYLFYVMYFPKLIMGPLCEPQPLLDEINSEDVGRINWDNVAHGLVQFSRGLAKKVILADAFSLGVNWGYQNYDLATSADWFMIMLFYTLEIYFDFSGYCDMARGVSRMLNINLPVNFDSPYKALSVRDFWKRWHISLTSFLTRYIYIPIGGSRKGKMRTTVNTMIVFIISGIWHGANLTFVLWGILHGALSVFDRTVERLRHKIPKVISWFFTFAAVNFLWLLFRSESITQWIDIITRMFSFSDMHISSDLIYEFGIPKLISDLLHLNYFNDHLFGAFSLTVYSMIALGICLIPENNDKRRIALSPASMIVTSLMLAVGILCLGRESVFLYFGF